ncbi:MAG: hypothetical protein K2X55_30545 [Burkholderiaceae bacterium]|nr:hypothetical protein [Burkholderiaceae bacterium]
MKLYAIFLFLFFGAIDSVNAQSGQSYKLTWNVPGEELIYRSCGCADACWIAEIRNLRKMKVKATLRCDCEKLHFSEGKGFERVVAQDCNEFNDVGKMELISKRINELRSQADSKK